VDGYEKGFKGLGWGLFLVLLFLLGRFWIFDLFVTGFGCAWNNAKDKNNEEG
jgi:hypothetical protein